MILFVDSISITTPRIRSLRPPDSSSCVRNSSNCFSSDGAWGSPSAIVAEQSVAEEERNGEAGEQRSDGNTASFGTARNAEEMNGMLGLGFKKKREEEREEEEKVKRAFRITDFMFWYYRTYIFLPVVVARFYFLLHTYVF